ncbi:MAG: hypothetical protein G3M78_07645 [Candidatus Nitrohelix vancouverensis]|uniref:Uncharacterized protein n=1 Tax=Candidatus Nitrohelix vancouverensis TaxID=2705534 RepID=A0A7T0G3H7_9BACT|nr:MAG: hypothetical protein G3M78_07645 [Candidatus Nitrohelix vancouverensis]
MTSLTQDPDGPAENEPTNPPTKHVSSPTKTLIRWLLAIDRHWITALLASVFILFNLQTDSIKPNLDKLYQLTSPILNYGHSGDSDWIYSYIHNRGVESCSSIPGLKTKLNQSLNQKKEQIKAQFGEQMYGWSAIFNYVASANEEIRNFYFTTQCDGEWEFTTNTTYVIRWASQVIPVAWILSETNFSHVHIGLILLVILFISPVFVFLVVRNLSASTLLGLVSFAFLYKTQLFHITLYGALTMLLGQILFNPNSWFNSLKKYKRVMIEASLGILFGIHTLAYLFILPVHHKMNATLVLALLLLIGIFKLNKLLVVRALFAGLCLSIATHSFTAYGENLYKPISAVNAVKNTGLAYIGLFSGIGERYNHYGMIHSDFGHYRSYEYDQYLKTHAWSLINHQTISQFGKDSMVDIAQNRPGDYFEGLWKRMYALVRFQDQLNNEMSDLPKGGLNPYLPLFYFGLALVLSLSLYLLAFPFSWVVCMPPMAIAFYEYFGISSSLFMIHQHGRYYIPGMLFLILLIPGLLGFLLRNRNKLACFRAPEFSRTGFVAASAIIVSLLVSTPYFIKESKKEDPVFRIWYYLLHTHKTTPDIANPEWLRSQIETIRTLGNNEPGSVELFGAWSLHLWSIWRYDTSLPEHWRPRGIPNETFDEYRKKADALKVAYFRHAIKKAPDNPYYPAYAYTLGDPEWPIVFDKALDKFPDHPFAANMAHMLIHATSHDQFSPGHVKKWARQMEEGYRRLFRKTENMRPGFRKIPGFDKPPTDVSHSDFGLLIKLNPGETIELNPSYTYYAPELKIGIFADLGRGELKTEVVFPDGSTCKNSGIEMKRDDLYKYRILNCSNTEGWGKLAVRIKAGDTPASFLLRDYYPMIEKPRITGKLAAEFR